MTWHGLLVGAILGGIAAAWVQGFRDRPRGPHARSQPPSADPAFQAECRSVPGRGDG